jgi:competence protein ComEC
MSSMAVSDHVPGLVSGATTRNVVVGVCYLVVLPLVIVALPFYLLVAVGTNRNGLAETLAESPLGVVPSIRAGGWSAALTLCLAAFVFVGTLGVLVPVDGGVDSVLDDGISVETTDLSEYEIPDDTGSESNTDDQDSQGVSSDTSNDQDGTGSEDSTEHDQTESGTATGEENEQSGLDNATTAIPAGTLEIHHIDVGQAESTLLITPSNETILIDTGDWQDEGETVIDYLDGLGIERIDHLIGTHPHADHIGGHAESIAHYEQTRDGVGNIYDSGMSHDTETYAEYLDAVEASNHELLLVEEGDELPLESENLSARVLNPTSDREGSIHYNSIALVFEFGEVRYLSTGDAESAAEQRLVTEWREELSADIYQAGHQGSSTSSTREFLRAVDPRVAVISSARDSQFGHPHDEVLDRFAEMDIETYWTGVHGDVVIETDGRNVTVETSEPFSTDPLDLLDAKQNNSARFTLAPTTMRSGIGVARVMP